MRKIVKTTTVGSLKNKLNESKGNFAFGQGFGSEPRFKSNVQDNSDYSRKLDKNGGFGLGDGFTKLNEEEMVDFIANIVESMKGKTEYHNLKFVDRIGNENGLFESQIKNIKNIIKSDRTPYQLKLRKYLTENVAKEMSGIYEGYSGLMHEGEMMVNEIKSTFNEMKSMGKSTNEAVAMTAEALDVPMEMVDKMVQVQKEAYKARMEGMGETMDINEKLCEVYESYKNMAEGNMKPVYDELKEMMNPEEESEKSYNEKRYNPETGRPYINPKTGEEYTEGEMDDYQSTIDTFGSGEEIDFSKFGKNQKYQTPEEESEEADSADFERKIFYRDDYLEEDLCMECDDMDDESYIEVELSSPEDFKLLPMLAKGAMSAERMPSMGMDKMSRAMNVPMEKDYQDYEVPMDSTSNPYSQYRYDTGLGKIPYGKKKFMSDEENESSLSIPQDVFESVFKRKADIKISYCNKYFMIENRIFLSETGEEIKNKLLVESLLIEGWNLLDYAQQIVSVVSIFLPGIGNAALFVNGCIYFVRAYTTSEGDDMKWERYTNAILDVASALIPTVFGIIAAGFRGAIAAAKTAAATSKTLKILKDAVSALTKYGGQIINAGILKFLNFKLVKWLLGKKVVQGLISSIKSIFTGIIGWIQKNILKAGSATTKVAKLAGKKGFDEFFKKGAVKIIANKGTELLVKLGYKVGQTVTIKGQKFIIKSISAKQGKIMITNAKGISGQIPLDDFINTALKSNAFKTYANMVFKSPAAYAQGYKFLGGFGFGDDGSIAEIDLSNMPVIDVATQIAAENLDIEIAQYQGETGEYSSSGTVMAVQKALEALGEDIGATGADGKYGPVTKGAINKVETDLGAEQTAAGITVRTVANIGIALVKANKANEAIKLVNGLGADMNKNPIVANIKKILEDPAITDKLTAIQNAQGGASGSGAKKNWYDVPSGEKKGNWMDDLIAKSKGTSTVAEETFSESYKRMFGLTLD